MRSRGAAADGGAAVFTTANAHVRLTYAPRARAQLTLTPRVPELSAPVMLTPRLRRSLMLTPRVRISVSWLCLGSGAATFVTSFSAKKSPSLLLLPWGP